MTLSALDASERRMTVHLLSGEFGLTECGLLASTVHATAFSQNIDCARCAKLWLDASCFDDDPRNCAADLHRRAAHIAYPHLEVVR